MPTSRMASSDSTFLLLYSQRKMSTAANASDAPRDCVARIARRMQATDAQASAMPSFDRETACDFDGQGHQDAQRQTEVVAVSEKGSARDVGTNVGRQHQRGIEQDQDHVRCNQRREYSAQSVQ